MRKSTFSELSVAALLAFGVTLAACSEEQPPTVQSVQPSAVPVSATSAPVNESTSPVTATAVAPPSATDPQLSPEALETLLAPVALYPDAVLAQVLASSTNPQEVLDAGNWLIANPDTKGKELDTAATAVGFTPPMMALMHFPSTVDMMCMEMDWTTDLGAAFQADEPGVLAAVQRLRKQAAEMGNLKTSEQMKVTTEEQNGERVIEVQPANPEVIYVPQYNPTAVYTTPAPVAVAPATTTTTVTDTGYSGGEMVATGLLAFGAGMLVNEVFNDDDDDDYYYPHYGYGGGGGYYPSPYQPRYGNGFRPAYGYDRPVNYQNGFNNNNIYVNADGKDYFTKFEGGRNSYRKNADSPISAARQNRPELGELNQRAQGGNRPATLGQGDARKARGDYAGAKPGARQNTSAQRPSANNRGPTGTYAGARPNARPNTPTQRPAATSKVPEGTYAGAANPAARQKLNPQTAGARDRGHTAGTVAKPAARPQSVSKPAARKTPASSSSAFQGSRNNGNAERAASNRGRASMPKGSRPSANRSSGQRQGNRSGQSRGGRR